MLWTSVTELRTVWVTPYTPGSVPELKVSEKPEGARDMLPSLVLLSPHHQSQPVSSSALVTAHSCSGMGRQGTQ